MSEHGIGLPQVLQLALVTLHRHAGLRGELPDGLVLVGQELVQGRIERADGDWVTVHDFEYPGEVASLDRQQPGQRLPAAGFVIGQDHLPDGIDPVFLEEHVLRPAKADALGAEGARGGRLIGLVRVGPHLKPAVPVGPGHQAFVPLIDLRMLGRHGFLQQDLQHFGGNSRNGAGHDLPGGPVDGDIVSFGDDLFADAHLTGGVVDIQLSAAGDADLAHLAGDKRRVARHAAPGGQDTHSGVHAAYVLGRRLDTDQDDRVAAVRPGLGIGGVEHHFARCGARTGVEAPGQHPTLLLRAALFLHIEYGAQ